MSDRLFPRHAVTPPSDSATGITNNSWYHVTVDFLELVTAVVWMNAQVHL